MSPPDKKKKQTEKLLRPVLYSLRKPGSTGHGCKAGDVSVRREAELRKQVPSGQRMGTPGAWRSSDIEPFLEKDQEVFKSHVMGVSENLGVYVGPEAPRPGLLGTPAHTHLKNGNSTQQTLDVYREVS